MGYSFVEMAGRARINEVSRRMSCHSHICHFQGTYQGERYDENVEEHFRRPECNVESFSCLLTGRLSSDTPVRKTLQTDENSNILMYMTGHGGDEFFKFHDTQEISSQDMGYLLRDMYAKNRYEEALLVVDTCQASTFSNHIDVPGVYTLTSSVQGENSYAHDTNVDLAMAVSGRFTHFLVEYLQRKGERRKKKGTEVGEGFLSPRPGPQLRQFRDLDEGSLPIL